jgi:hypothetical protein
MTRAVRWILFGSALVALVGCGKGFMQFAEREPWRREAEVACLASGAVREGANIIRVRPIDGPGVCGADFPLKVAALGANSVLGYAGEVVRPPGAIPGPSAPASQPRWPIADPQYRPPQGEPQFRWQRGPDPYHSRQPEDPSNHAQPSEPQHRPPQAAPRSTPPVHSGEPMPINPSPVVPRARGIDRAPLPAPHGHEPQVYPRSNASQHLAPTRQLPALGPRRSPPAVATPVEIEPAATLACPVVSALDRWIASAVQPAAQKWFGRPVVEIRQISAYSCRGMNGQSGARISEHAFGNALDIAAFVLADGHRITVKDGWRGSPEEQGFLRDVQAAACDQFTTVLAPGSNRFHYDHMHVDLMRRASGRRICEPGAVDGELVAARARRNPALAARPIDPASTRRYDPSFDANSDPFAWRGDRRRRDVTGAVGSSPARAKPEDDLDWIEEPGPRPSIDWNDRHRLR